MTTNRIVIIVGAVVIPIGLLIVTFVGGVVGFALYTVGYEAQQQIPLLVA